jgi:hypothetical protein
VEVNSWKGIIITIYTGSVQRDTVSSVLFLTGSEPLNKLIATKFPEIINVISEGVTLRPILFADDDLSPLKFQCIKQLDPLLANL